MAVYFIQAGENGPVKIGKADEPQSRLDELQVAHWTPLALMRVIEGGHLVERWLHRFYASLHLRGEWFKFSECMRTIDPPRLEETARPHRFCHYVAENGGATEVAKLLGVSPAGVRMWLAGHRVPSKTVMVKIIEVTGGKVRPNDFYEAA